MPQRRRAAHVRVISLVPAATEIIAALGAADRLVGVSHECRLPDGREQTPRVTESALEATRDAASIHAEVSAMARTDAPLFRLRGDEIAALRPDVIVTQGLCAVCAVSDRDVRSLAARLEPTPRVVSISGSTLDAVFNDITTVATALELRADAERLLTALRTRMRSVHHVLSASRAPRPRVAVLEWTDPPFAAGHWVPEMVYRAGGEDVLAVSGQHSREMTWDAITDTAPAIVAIAPCGYDLAASEQEARQLAARDPWVHQRALWALDARSLVSQPGPGLIDGIETMAAIFHPGLFEPPPMSRAIPLTAG